MSYDIYLKDPVSRETIQLPVEHVMTGGTYAATYDEQTGTWLPLPIRDAHLNITYNYSNYYYDATEGDPRFAHEEVSCIYADGTEGPIETRYGIRGIYGKSGAESIPMLLDMILRIEIVYKKDGEWISTERRKLRYFDMHGREITDVGGALLRGIQYTRKEEPYEVSEGPNDNYWIDTAGNAIRPLYQLIAMAKMRPDGVWDGD